MLHVQHIASGCGITEVDFEVGGGTDLSFFVAVGSQLGVAMSKVGASHGPGVFTDEQFEQVARQVVSPDLEGFEYFVESHGTKFYRKYKEVIPYNKLREWSVVSTQTLTRRRVAVFCVTIDLELANMGREASFMFLYSALSGLMHVHSTYRFPSCF